MLYMQNNVRMDLDIILISQSPSRMLFDPTDTAYNARTILNNFKLLKVGIGWCTSDLHAE